MCGLLRNFFPHIFTRDPAGRDELVGDMEPQTRKPKDKPADQVGLWLNKADDFARDEPTKAMVSAFGAGFLINLLPIGALIGGLVALAFSLARPALLFFGLLKAVEFVNTKSAGDR